MKLMIIAVLAMLALLAGCATNEISNSTLGVKLAPESQIATGLKDAAFNLDSAIAIGVLKSDDRAAACVHGVMLDAGLEGDASTAQSFAPRVSDLISASSVAYIEAQRLKALQGMNLQMPQGCEAVIGRIVIDGAKASAKLAPSLMPGGSVLQLLGR